MKVLLEGYNSKHIKMGINILIIIDIIMIVYILLLNPSGDHKFFMAFDVIVCAILLADFFYELNKANQKKKYFRRYYLYLIASIPMELVLPFPSIAFRFILLIKLFKSELFKKYFESIHRFMESTKFDKLLTWIIFTVIVFTFAIYILDPTLGLFDSFWFVAVTLTTVGYGDVTPSNFTGKIISVLLLIIGIFVFSALTGAIASYFNDKILDIHTDVEDDMDIVLKKLDEMSLELEGVKEELELARSENKELHEKLDEVLKK